MDVGRSGMNEALRGTTGLPWTRFEIEAAVAGYLEMLAHELRGERYTKADVVRELSRVLPARSRGSIELKLQNISAVLHEQGREWIEGYKPMPHYQHDLRRAVLEALARQRRMGEALAEYASSPVAARQPHRLATRDVTVPVPQPGSSRRRVGTSVCLTGGPVSALRDFQCRELGIAGEEWVLGLESEQLRRAG
jgi:hypothetical protein